MEHSRNVGARAVFRAASVLIGVTSLACTAAAQEHVVINFDDPSIGVGVHYGGIFLDRGVRITSCMAPDAVPVGGTITMTGLQPWFEIWQWGWAVSAPNYLLPLNVGTTDVLLTFTVPVTSVGLDLDLYAFETIPNVIRLVALESAGGNSYTVLKVVEAADGAAAPPATHLAIDLGGTAFSAALFQVVTELEGFDNLQFNTTGPIPPPSGEGPPGPPPAGSGGWAGGGGGTTPEPPTTNENSSNPENPTVNPENPTVNENKAPDLPTTGDQTSGTTGDSGTSADQTDVNSGSDGSGTGAGAANNGSNGNGSGGGACGAPVAIILLCGMLMLRLLAGHSGPRKQ
jgi:hypothetical protein